MIIEDKTYFKKVIADEGKYLTQVTLTEDNTRLFIISVCTTRPQEWEEWTSQQRETWELEHPIEGIDEIVEE